MKILLLYKEEEAHLAGEFRLPAEIDSPVENFPINSADGMRLNQEKLFSSSFSRMPLAGNSVIPPTHVVILSALGPGWIDFLAGFSCGCQIPLLVYGNAVKCVPDVYNFCFKLFETEKGLQEYLTAEYKTQQNMDSQKGSNVAREALLALGIPVREKVFADCVDEGLIKEVSLFLEAGFSPDIKNENGVPLICLAARKGKREILQLLIRAGAQVNQPAQDRGCPAIFDAALGKHGDMIRDLIEAGADLNVTSKDGQTALVVAVGAGDIETSEILYRAGADPDIADCLGASARKYATLFQIKPLLDLFNDPSVQKAK